VLEKVYDYLTNNEIDSAFNLILEIESEFLVDSDYWNLRGMLCLKVGEYQTGIGCLREAFTINPKNRDAYFNYAYAYENLGYLIEAAKYYGIAYYYSAEDEMKDQLNSMYKDKNALKEIFEAAAKGEFNTLRNEEMKNSQLLLQEEFKNRLVRNNHAKKQSLILKRRNNKERLHIVYVMTHVGICGGVKIILEHAKRLKSLGMEVSIVSHYPTPTWFPIDVNNIEVPFEVELANGIPNCDVIVATYWNHIQVCIDTEIAPVIYFEQGDFHLFNDENLNPTLKDFICKQYQLPEFIFTVSNQCAEFIRKIYNRDSIVIHNAIDTNIFNTIKEKITISDSPYVLMMGNPELKFKGISEIIKAFSIIKSSISDIKLYLITPVNPAEEIIDKVDQIFVNPSQQQIAELYKGALLYVSASHYESFSLPVLEAMACGCPVVTTGNSGVMEYTVDNYNAIITKIGDHKDISTKILELLENTDLRKNLIKNGLNTAEKFNWDDIISQLLYFYRDVARYEVIK
jgi:L-malate glycosyltransferase